MLASTLASELDFTTPDLQDQLDRLDDAGLDALGFGVIRMNRAGHVVAYNALESRMAGLSRDRVMTKHFFTEVAPCTNNYLVSGRFEEPGVLDQDLPYVFTLRMRPTPVRLRLLKRDDTEFQYLLVQRGPR